MHEDDATRAYHILFIGFMGSGKSSVASRLGRLFSRRVIDLDALISRRAGLDIPTMFAQEGEESFRLRETSALASLLHETPSVVACGGGVVERSENRELLGKLGTVVYLKVDAAEAIDRISRPQTRPLLAAQEEMAALLAHREPLYESVCNLTIDTQGKTVEDIVNMVGEALWERNLL